MLSEFLNEHFEYWPNQHFKTTYNIDFLKWALCVPGFFEDWHIGVKATGKDKLLAFIAGTPRVMNVSR